MGYVSCPFNEGFAPAPDGAHKGVRHGFWAAGLLFVRVFSHNLMKGAKGERGGKGGRSEVTLRRLARALRTTRSDRDGQNIGVLSLQHSLFATHTTPRSVGHHGGGFGGGIPSAAVAEEATQE